MQKSLNLQSLHYCYKSKCNFPSNYIVKKLKLLVTEREISLCLNLWPQCTVILPLCRSLYTHIFRELCGTNLMVHGWTTLQLWQVDRGNPFYSSSVQKYLLNSTLFKRMNYLSLFFPFSPESSPFQVNIPVIDYVYVHTAQLCHSCLIFMRLGFTFQTRSLLTEKYNFWRAVSLSLHLLHQKRHQYLKHVEYFSLRAQLWQNKGP